MLEQLGYKQEFKRDFSFLGLWSLCSSELAVLPGVAGTIWYVEHFSAPSRPPELHSPQVHDGILVSSPMFGRGKALMVSVDWSA